MRCERWLTGLLVGAMMTAGAWAAEAGNSGQEKGKADSKGLCTDGDVRVILQAAGEAKKAGGPKVQLRAVRVGPDGKIQALEAAGGGPLAVGVARGVPAGGAWVGIRVSPVPAALDAQLGLDGKGVMVANVVKGSPADKAGLERYDVIVGVGKEPVAEAEGFIAAVRKRKPGEKLSLWVMHGGRKKAVAVTLGKAPADPDQWEYIYEDDPDEQWADELRLRPGLLRKGPGGWIFETPKGGLQVRIGGTGGKKQSIKVSRTIDGETVEIEQHDGGEIVVRRRVDRDGDKAQTVRKYKNADELRRGDPKAYELYESVKVDVRAIGASRTPPWPKDQVVPQLLPPGKVFPRQSIEALRKAQEQFQKELREQVRRLSERARTEAREVRERIEKQLRPAPVRREFTVDGDGRVTVQVREGETAAKLSFESVEEMRKKAPKLYDAYEKLLKSE